MKIETNKLHCFNCVSKNFEDLSTGGYINEIYTNFSSDNLIFIDNYTFFGRSYAGSVWISETKNLILLTRKGIKQLERASLKSDNTKNCNYAKIRENIVEFWVAARHIIIKNNGITGAAAEILNDLYSNLNGVVEKFPELNNLPDYVLQNLSKGSNASNPAFHLVHLYLDLKWINLTLMFEKCSDKDQIENEIFDLLKNLVYVAMKKYDRTSLEGLPFLCPCFKQIWLLLQLLIEKNQFYTLSKDFWTFFNETIENILVFNTTPDGGNAFTALWILYHVAQIQGYDSKGNLAYEENSIFQNSRIVSNYSLVEKCLKSILNAECDEKRFRSTLHFVLFFQTKWWTRDINFELLQILWEHFYRRIQTSFVIQTDAGHKNVFSAPQKFLMINFCETVDSLARVDQNNNTSYELFLYLLHNFLKKNPSYWSKLKGRIYSKISVSKLASFNDIGLQNLITLLLVLADSVNFSELCDKLLSLLSQMPQPRCVDNSVIWSTYVSLILMYIKRDLSIRTIVTPFLNLVEEASLNKSKSQLIKMFVDGLCEVADCSDNLQCDQHLIFASSWLKNYLQWCTINEVRALLELVMKLIEKLRYHEVPRDWSVAIDSYIVPALINLAVGNDSPSIVFQLAATIVSIDCQKYGKIAEQFTRDSITIENVEKFLRYLLEKADIHQLVVHQTLLIQAWIKISMFSQSDHYLNDIISQISKFPEWTQTFGSFDISETEDVLYAIIKSAGIRVRDAKNITEVASMKRWFEVYFGKMDIWVQNILTTNEKNDNNKLLIRVYTYGALLFLHCCSALYAKNKTNTLLHRLVSAMLLPSSILMNKKPSENLLAALKLTWHLFVRGLMQLDYTNDGYIERILKDIVIRYVPHLYDPNSPIIRCLDYEFKDKDTAFITDKICTLIAYRSRQVSEYAQPALNLISEMLMSKKDTNKLKILIDKSIPSILELVMFVENSTYKKLITNIFYAIANHQNFQDFKEKLDRSIISIIDKHLAFYSTSVFQMLEFLTKIMKSEILQILPQLKSSIEKVEKMRGVGYDNTLRKGLQDIQELSKKT